MDPIKLVLCLPGNNFSAMFLQCLTSFLMECSKLPMQLTIVRKPGSDVVAVRNACLLADLNKGKEQKPFNEQINYTHILWVDSDIKFSFQDFYSLLCANTDIVSGMYMEEGGKHFVCGNYIEGSHLSNFVTMETFKDAKEKNFLFEVNFNGFGFMLIKKGVFEKLEYPWFQQHIRTPKNDVTGILPEDIYFCQRVREAGYKVYITPQVVVGHEKRIVI